MWRLEYLDCFPEELDDSCWPSKPRPWTPASETVEDRLPSEPLGRLRRTAPDGSGRSVVTGFVQDAVEHELTRIECAPEEG